MCASGFYADGGAHTLDRLEIMVTPVYTPYFVIVLQNNQNTCIAWTVTVKLCYGISHAAYT